MQEEGCFGLCVSIATPLQATGLLSASLTLNKTESLDEDFEITTSQLREYTPRKERQHFELSI